MAHRRTPVIIQVITAVDEVKAEMLFEKRQRLSDHRLQDQLDVTEVLQCNSLPSISLSRSSFFSLTSGLCARHSEVSVGRGVSLSFELAIFSRVYPNLAESKRGRGTGRGLISGEYRNRHKLHRAAPPAELGHSCRY